MSRLRFDVALHPCPGRVVGGPPLIDAWGTWSTVVVPPDAAGTTMAADLDGALARLAALERAYVEPDGSFVWVGGGAEGPWQIDGNAYERHGCVLVVEVKGNCPGDILDHFLRVWGWPGQALVFQLVRAGVYLDEPTFRRHAAAAGMPAASGED